MSSGQSESTSPYPEYLFGQSFDVAVDILDAWLLEFPGGNVQAIMRKKMRAACNRWPLKNGNRRMISDLVLGSVVWKRRVEHDIAFILDSYSAPEIHSLTPGRFLCLVYIKLYKNEILESATSDPTIRQALEISSPPFSDDPAERIAVQWSHPLWIVREWMSQWGEEDTERICRVNNKAGPTFIRTNHLVSTPEEVAEELAKHNIQTDRVVTEFVDALRLVASDGRATPLIGHGTWSLEPWHNGCFEVQDLGSQTICAICDAQPGDTVIDYCAGNGGKSLALAAMVGNNGEVRSWDVDKRRLKHLEANARRAKADQIIQVVESEEELSDLRGDVVLCDVPCSSAGTLRRHPCNRWRIDEEESTEALPQLQKEIVSSAIKLVKPGGIFVYATCSLLRHENEEVVQWIESSYPEFEKFDFGDTNYQYLKPEEDGSDGFFFARWRKH